MKLIQTRFRPAKVMAAATFRDSPERPVSLVFEWMRDAIRGTVWWSKTQFRDPKVPGSHFAHFRKRNFKDGYWVYSFYFSLKSDAAKFIMVWGKES